MDCIFAAVITGDGREKKTSAFKTNLRLPAVLNQQELGWEAIGRELQQQEEDRESKEREAEEMGQKYLL